jgi:hypothetical protein
MLLLEAILGVASLMGRLDCSFIISKSSPFSKLGSVPSHGVSLWSACLLEFSWYETAAYWLGVAWSITLFR